MITLAQLQAFSRYMDRELLHEDVAPMVYFAEYLIAHWGKFTGEEMATWGMGPRSS